MPPDVKIHSLTAGGVPELIDEWSQDSKTIIIDLIKEELGVLPLLRLSFIEEDSLSTSDKLFIKEEKGLFSAVANGVVMHTYLPESKFKHKLESFDYTLGPEVSQILDIHQCDALLFCSGSNYIWTTGRVILSIFSTLAGAATGVYVIPMPGPEWIMVSLVDVKTGDVVWFNYIPMPGDLRNKEVDRKLIKKLFSDFPKK
jgi:hypothetical protein